MDRRTFLGAGAAGIFLRNRFVGSARAQPDAGAAGYRRRLRLAPPPLSNPATHYVTDTNFNLTHLGAGDHIIVLPKTPLTKWLKIDGRNVARNIVLIGGEIEPEQLYDPTTMMLSDGSDFAVYSEIGFSGASGGTFRIKTMSAPWYHGFEIPLTDPIPWNASTATIKAAINAAFRSPDACSAVAGPDTPGGPWKIVPGDNASLGRCSVIPAGLSGDAALTKPRYKFNIAPHGVDFKQWTGTLHVEGLLVGARSPWGGDATNIQTCHGTAVAQFANCHLAANFDRFNNDWNHPDGSQFFLGPAKFYAENCDFISKGGAGFIGQPRKVSGSSAGSLEALYDWWFRNVQFRGLRRDDDRRIPDVAARNNSSAAFQETDWPGPNRNGAGWRWIMENCFANKHSWSNPTAEVKDADRQTYFNYFIDAPPRHYEYPDGLAVGATPPTPSGFVCDPAFGQCGLGYASPGYTGEPLPEVRQRLAGNNLV